MFTADCFKSSCLLFVDCPISVSIIKVPANEDTLLRTHCCRHKCFPVCLREQQMSNICCGQNFVPGTEKWFWFCSETFCVRNKCFPVCAAQETSWATMCPQQCVLVYQGLNVYANVSVSATSTSFPGPFPYLAFKIGKGPRERGCCNVTPDLYREKLSSHNRHRANRTAWLEWLLIHRQW